MDMYSYDMGYTEFGTTCSFRHALGSCITSFMDKELLQQKLGGPDSQESEYLRMGLRILLGKSQIDLIRGLLLWLCIGITRELKWSKPLPWPVISKCLGVRGSISTPAKPFRCWHLMEVESRGRRQVNWGARSLASGQWNPEGREKDFQLPEPWMEHTCTLVT